MKRCEIYRWYGWTKKKKDMCNPCDWNLNFLVVDDFDSSKCRSTLFPSYTSFSCHSPDNKSHVQRMHSCESTPFLSEPRKIYSICVPHLLGIECFLGSPCALLSICVSMVAPSTVRSRKKKETKYFSKTNDTHSHTCFDCNLFVLNARYSIKGGQPNKSDNPACLVVPVVIVKLFIFHFSFILTRAKNFYVCFCTIRKWFNPLSFDVEYVSMYFFEGGLVFYVHAQKNAQFISHWKFSVHKWNGIRERFEIKDSVTHSKTK